MKYVVASVGILTAALLLFPPKPKTGPPESATSATAMHRAITRQQFSALRTGMTYESVVEILGREGEEISRSRMDGIRGIMEPIETVMYQWTNPGFGGNMNTMFQNGGLISKAQFGLR